MTHPPERPKWKSWWLIPWSVGFECRTAKPEHGEGIEVVPLDDVKALLRTLKYYAGESNKRSVGVHESKDGCHYYLEDMGERAREQLSQVPPEWLE